MFAITGIWFYFHLKLSIKFVSCIVYAFIQNKNYLNKYIYNYLNITLE